MISEFLFHVFFVIPPLPFLDNSTFGNIESCSAQNLLLHVFVHSQSRCEYAWPRIGYPQKFQKTLYTSVISIFSMQRDEGEIDFFLEILVKDPARLFF